MQVVNALVAIGGDAGNQVQKFKITVAEVAVLNAIHGDGAVTDIEPAGEITRSHREERSRLIGIYGRMQDGRDVSPVSALFPGAAARVFEHLDELDLPEEMFKAKSRVTANDAPAARPAAPAEKPPTAAERKAQRQAAKQQADAEAARQQQAASAQAASQEQAQQAADDDAGDDGDGIGEMNDSDGVLD